jgi:hypothetical protein
MVLVVSVCADVFCGYEPAQALNGADRWRTRSTSFDDDLCVGERTELLDVQRLVA